MRDQFARVAYGFAFAHGCIGARIISDPPITSKRVWLPSSIAKQVKAGIGIFGYQTDKIRPWSVIRFTSRVPPLRYDILSADLVHARVPLMQIDPSLHSNADNYKLITNLVVPRPIAWVTSQNQSGVINLAPFSFFNAVGANPRPLTLTLSRLRERG